MIDSISAHLEIQAAARSRSRVTPEFSYAQASAALEQSAGQSLKAFGGKPPPVEAQAPHEAPAGEAKARSKGSPRAVDQKDPADVSSSVSPRATMSSAPAPDSAPAPLNSVPPIDSVAAGPGTAAVAVASGNALSTSIKLAAPLEVASATGARAQAIDKPARPALVARATSPDEFAELIAKRLDSGATEFELRLDPPELGRIEARLVVGEDGEAQLSIKFENQAAYDLFARDDAALRLAFAAAGYSFGGSGLVFVLDEGRDAMRPAFGDGAEPAAPRAAYSAFVASSRAFDVKV